MKKLLTLFIAFTIVSCNDGDFSVPDFDFEDEVYGCWDNNIVYVTNSSGTEAMVITLIDDELGTEVGTATYDVSSTREVVYRIFNDGIDGNYFCQAIPPTTPTVTTELIAESGTISITTSEVYDEDDDTELTGYSYLITFSHLLFYEDDGDRIFFETLAFGDEFEVDIDD
ncbi:hypothetical protein ACFQ5N_10580 [Lutibacter holmesii]|uniref:Lipocalin-like domain-containing protein n=1 Tax=Lutibacter holmesii TaxID=1137985 RepID=A0ABW3WQU2_9FLAO